MTGKILPRYLILSLTLAAVVTGLMLSIFYAQYHWLAGSMARAGAAQHERTLAAGFERRSRARLQRIAASLVFPGGAVDTAENRELFDHVVQGQDAFVGLSFVRPDGSELRAGALPPPTPREESSWGADYLTIGIPVVRDGERLGLLAGNFDVSGIREATEEFAAAMLAAESDQRRLSFLWIGASTAVMLLLSGCVVWLIIGAQNRRIHELKVQAEKLSEANFGEPLHGPRGDALSNLVDVFNKMRSRLKQTTISRDYCRQHPQRHERSHHRHLGRRHDYQDQRRDGPHAGLPRGRTGRPARQSYR
ncbi:MAG: methyl-accepting chemotaxis protein [Woeseiaceae bacterium]|nr:methyl-accepting chemotaxis protein [Woeseiaceae bacterium]